MQDRSAKFVGKVYLVGAGPGDPRLITLRGRDCLAEADLVLYDYLINPALLAHCRPTAELACLGHPHVGRAVQQEEINRRLVEAANAGKVVVRLKSGDPYLFGRGAEEVEVLQGAGIPYEVVPGVTSAMAAAAYAGVPITHRGFASAVALVTGHQRADKSGPEFDYQRLGTFPGTIVIYMGMTTAAQWSEGLIRGGQSPDTPVLILRRVSWPDQEMVRTTLGQAAQTIQAQNLRPPALIIVGQAAGVVPDESWFTRLEEKPEGDRK
jgi:uroporphyrinogen III methyltransferase/synthase